MISHTWKWNTVADRRQYCYLITSVTFSKFYFKFQQPFGHCLKDCLIKPCLKPIFNTQYIVQILSNCLMTGSYVTNSKNTHKFSFLWCGSFKYHVTKYLEDLFFEFENHWSKTEISSDFAPQLRGLGPGGAMVVKSTFLLFLIE